MQVKLTTERIRSESFQARFWKNVKKTSGCWLWIGKRVRRKWPYGRISYCIPGQFKGHIQAHRASWVIHFGAIPEGIYVLHKCDNPPCVNPDHLFLGTDQDNMTDMIQKGRAAHREKHPGAILDWNLVRLIRKIHQVSRRKMAETASICKVSVTTVHDIIENKTWRDPDFTPPPARWRVFR